jgi:hypothetical protein
VSKKGLTGAVLIKGIAIGAGKFEETALGEASRKAIQDAVDFIIKNMEEVPWQGRVVSVQDNNAYINASQESGINVGDVLEVYKRGEELVDPDTGMSLGYQISRIGYAQISQIEEKFSIAQVIGGSGGSKGDIVKLLEGGISSIPPVPPKPPEKTAAPKMRIMVIIPEVHITRKIPDPAGETEIIKKLLEKGFDVVDQKMVDAIRYDEQVAKAMKDEKAAAGIGRDYGADVIIIGEAFSEFAGRQPGGMISCRARVEARAIKIDTGSILAADGKHGSGMDISENVAAKTALRQAGGELADYFIKQCDDYFKQLTSAESVKTPTSAGTVQILLSKIQSYGQLIQFEKAIKGIEGVKEVHRLSFSDGRDILPVSMYWKKTGQTRIPASTAWEAQQATPWTPQEATYADADGNGIIDGRDILPIGANWKKTHPGGTPAAPYFASPALRHPATRDIYDTRLDHTKYLSAYQMMLKVLEENPIGKDAIDLKQVLRELIALATRPIPLENLLGQNFPNPFNPETWIPYQLAQEADVVIEFYDVSGRLVQTLSLGKKEAGMYLTKDTAAHWDGRNSAGEKVSSGIFFYCIKAGTFSALRKMVIMK